VPPVTCRKQLIAMLRKRENEQKMLVHILLAGGYHFELGRS